MAPPTVPSLVPLPPQRTAPVTLQASPFWLGSRHDCALPLFLPGVADRHAALVERADGFWVTPGSGPTTVNGTPIGSGWLLEHGDVIELAPGCRFRFDSGIAAAPPPVATAPPEQPSAPTPRRRKPRGLKPSSRFPLGFKIAAGVATLLLVAALTVIVRAVRGPSDGTQLTTNEAIVFDSLLAVTYEHIERGTTLLELGANPQALQEFARGVNTLKASSLRAHPFVVPRIEALEASVAAIYREKREAVPAAYARAAERTHAPAAVLTRTLRAVLSTTEFTQQFDVVRRQFTERFGSALTITGADHAEHVSLYGRGGALDLRTRTLTPEQVQWVIGQCRAVGIRVKDFSRDAVLQQQIRAAQQAGLADRAGTGVHLHIDRFANRRDAYTVQ